MFLSHQVNDLKNRFTEFQANLNKKGTNDIESQMAEAQVFQDCYDMQCALEHTVKNFTVFQDVFQTLMLANVSKSRFIASNQFHKPHTKWSVKPRAPPSANKKWSFTWIRS